MKTRKQLSIIIFSLLVLPIQLFAQETYSLNYKFEKGKTYFYHTTSKLEMTMNVMGQEMNSTGDSKSKMRIEITDSSPEKIELISSLDSMYVKSVSDQVDQDNNGENIVGKKTKFIYNINGKKLKSIEIDPIGIENGMSGFGGSVGLLEISYKPVKMGEVWTVITIDTNKVGDSGQFIIKTDTEYKLEGKEIKNGIECLKLNYKSSMKIESSSSTQGMDMVMEGTGKSTGILFFSTAKGFIYSNDSNIDISITMAMPAQNMTILMTQKIKSSSVFSEK